MSWRSRFALPTRFGGLFLIGAPLASIGWIAYFLLAFQSVQEQTNKSVQQSIKTQNELDEVLRRMYVADGTMRVFLLRGQDDVLTPYVAARDWVRAALQRFESASVSEGERSHLREIRVIVERQFETLSSLRQYASIPGVALARPPTDLLTLSERGMEELRRKMATVQKERNDRLESVMAASTDAQNRTQSAVIGIAILGFNGALAGVWLLRRKTVETERRRAQSAVLDQQRSLLEQLERAQRRADDLAASEEASRSHRRAMESVLESLSDGVVVLARNREVLLCNPAVARMFLGLAVVPMELWAEYYGLRLADADTPCDKATMASSRALRGEAVAEQILFKPSNDGGMWIRLSGCPLRSEDGNITGAVVIFTDITLQQRHQEMLSRAKDDAERANEAKSEFLSRMSHELRTPLNAILGFAQLLEMARLRAPHRDSVGQILKAGRHLLTLINEVLDIARIESGKLSLSPEPVYVSELLDEALAMVRPQGSERQIRIDAEQTKTTDLYMLADRQRLKQVVLNLLSNAIKYNRPGGMVTVLCEPSADRVRLMVADTGIGITEDKIERLFNPFERLGAEQTGVEGTGIGLALSKRLVDAMGGVIGVESRPEVGTTFWLEFPRAEAPFSPFGDCTGQLASAAKVIAEAYHPTVLCIEDNPSNLQLVERILSCRPDLRLITAPNGGTGLRLAQQHLPNLILLDVHLADMDGKEVLEQLKADPRTSAVPVVIISADATARQEARLREAGAGHYLTKPLDVQKFLDTVDEVLQLCKSSPVPYNPI